MHELLCSYTVRSPQQASVRSFHIEGWFCAFNAGMAESGYTEPVTLPSAPPLMPPFPLVIAPDSSSLLLTLSAALDTIDLRWIAEADHGRDADENERQLQRIASSGKVSSPLGWCPREVLELTRWDEPSPNDGEAVFWRCHLLRAFACAALLCSYGDGADYSYEGGRDATVVHLLGSLAVLGPTLADLDRDAIALLAWVIPRLAARELEDHPFFGFAALWFGLDASLSDTALLALAEWVMEAEDAVNGKWRESLGVGVTGPWLLTLVESRERRDKWRRVDLSLPGRIPARCSTAVREVVGLLAAMMGE